jgi:hypothetical protein
VDWLACKNQGTEACRRQDLAFAQFILALTGLNWPCLAARSALLRTLPILVSNGTRPLERERDTGARMDALVRGADWTGRDGLDIERADTDGAAGAAEGPNSLTRAPAELGHR